MNKKYGNSAQILGVSLFSRPSVDLLSVVAGWMSEKKGEIRSRLIFTPNSEMLVAGSEDGAFREVLNLSDINIPDGAGVVLASRLKGFLDKGQSTQTISTWIPGADFAKELLRLVEAKGGTVFLLGGWQGVAEEAAKRLKSEFPKLNIVFNMGREKFSDESWEEPETVELINKSKADLLLVAYGPVKQEKWLVANKKRLRVKVAMGVGGTFDFWAGRVRRAPRWVNRMALEWLWRLVMEPWRWRRQLKLFKFWWLVLKETLG